LNKLSFTVFIGSMLLLSACLSLDESSSLDDVKKQIRERFPSVLQISTSEYQRTIDLENSHQTVLLDVREAEEYQVSHIQGAMISTDLDAALTVLRGKPKDTKIVAYCSVGYRSSALAEQLMARGYTNVANMEGSIFEWANKKFPVYREDKRVNKVHIYNKTWGKLLDKQYHSL